MTKIFEVRDRSTCCIGLAIKPEVETEREQRLWSGAGYGTDPSSYVILISIRGGVSQAHDDPYAWGSRTWTPVHLYIVEHWDELKSGDLIDTRVLLGERDKAVFTDFPGW